MSAMYILSFVFCNVSTINFFLLASYRTPQNKRSNASLVNFRSASFSIFEEQSERDENGCYNRGLLTPYRDRSIYFT